MLDASRMRLAINAELVRINATTSTLSHPYYEERLFFLWWVLDPDTGEIPIWHMFLFRIYRRVYRNWAFCLLAPVPALFVFVLWAL